MKKYQKNMTALANELALSIIESSIPLENKRFMIQFEIKFGEMDSNGKYSWDLENNSIYEMPNKEGIN